MIARRAIVQRHCRRALLGCSILLALATTLISVLDFPFPSVAAFVSPRIGRHVSARSVYRMLSGRVALQAKLRSFGASSPVRSGGLNLRPSIVFAALISIASFAWATTRRRIRHPIAPLDRLSPREWTRMYRNLGLSEDASLSQVRRATIQLRKKYAAQPEALERVEKANLWIMTRFVVLKEEGERAKYRAEIARARPFRCWLQRQLSAYTPSVIGRMIEPPSIFHLRSTSTLSGICFFLGLCIPSQILNFVGLATLACVGLVYQRGRPEPVKDDMGNIGEVRQVNAREMAGAAALAGLSVLLGAFLTACQQYVYDYPFQEVFCISTCTLLWIVALFFKVYKVFE